MGSSSEVVPTADLEEACVGLNLLGSLLPPRKTPAASSHASTSCEPLYGEISLKGWLDHGKAGGVGWMSLGEFQMMLALIMRDGHYDEHLQIIPLQTMQQHIKKAATASVTAIMAGTRLKILKRNDPHGDPKNARVVEEFHMGVDDFLRNCEGLMNFLIKEYLAVNRNLLENKIIVFPWNIKDSHWGATFVFNPGAIEDTNSAKARGSPKPSFFRYCSKHPDGSRDIDLKKGVIWFLNLVYNYEKHQVHKI